MQRRSVFESLCGCFGLLVGVVVVVVVAGQPAGHP